MSWTCTRYFARANFMIACDLLLQRRLPTLRLPAPFRGFLKLNAQLLNLVVGLCLICQVAFLGLHLELAELLDLVEHCLLLVFVELVLERLLFSDELGETLQIPEQLSET